MSKHFRALLGFFCIAATSLSTPSSAQITTINYQAWSTSQCNAFASQPSINGRIHFSNIGQPRYGSSNDPIVLDCKYNVGSPQGTQYEIQYNFQANHQYNITVTAAAVTNGYFPILKLELANATPTAPLCSGPTFIQPAPGANSWSIGSSFFSDAPFSFNLGAQSFSKLTVAAIPDAASMSTGPLQSIIIRKIVINDVTPAAPPFTLVASSNARLCGNEDPVTFTIQNPTNAVVSSYKFYPQNGDWLYNGASVNVIEVIPPNNTVTLTPKSCSGNAYMRAKAIWQNRDVYANDAAVSVTTPDLKIYGPDQLLATEAGNYQLQGLLSTPINYGWPCTSHPTWSGSPSALAHVYSIGGNSPFTTYFYADAGTAGTTVTIQADVMMCGVNKHIEKGIKITTGKGFSVQNASAALQQDDDIMISPNPSRGKFRVSLSAYAGNATVTIRSADGRIVHKQDLSGPETYLDISTAPAGLYFAEINNGRRIITEKIIKE